jgi:RIO kinase 1|tara:strand:+ start:4376 stop:5224 length:849 start_codon:yes stop_codon:yes gene_type:complete
MKIPKLIKPLIEDGLISEVIQSIMSGKEASLYVVRCGTKIRCAKVYKEANKRSFKKSAQYQEGRKIKNSRRARAIQKGSKYGKQQQEETWQNAELLALCRVRECGVRVPETFGYFDGILLMELITNKQGHVAPRLADISMSKETALFEHTILVRYIVYMLCAGIIHGDLSEFNVLAGADGLVVIDLPQAVDASSNNNAEIMLKRDVDNITQYFSNFAPELINTRYGDEIWSLYIEGNLKPDISLTGAYEESTGPANVDIVMLEIKAAIKEEEARLARVKEAE